MFGFKIKPEGVPTTVYASASHIRNMPFVNYNNERYIEIGIFQAQQYR